MKYQRGLTLVELLVSLVISSLIVIAAASFFLGTSRTRDTQDAAGTLQDNARFATEIITKTLQQAGFQNYTAGSSGAAYRREVYGQDGEPDVRGYNNSAAGSDLDNGSHNRSSSRVNNSDTLIVRFQGSSSGGVADGTMIDCMGRSQGEASASYDRAYSIFEVRQSSTANEPELKCKYKNQTTGVFTSEVIVRGVETLQFMYGVDTNADSSADTWKNARQVDSANQWRLVKAVRVGMVLRSSDRVNTAASTATYYPLGSVFTQSSGTDPGGAYTVSTNDGRLRQVVTFTVNLRNGL